MSAAAIPSRLLARRRRTSARWAVSAALSQQRKTIVAVFLLFMVLGAIVLAVGLDAHSSYRHYLSCGRCYEQASFFQQKPFGLYPPLFAICLEAVAVFLGVFAGAPLISGEVERGTHRFAWTQAVGRRRWIIGRLVLLGLAAAVPSACLGLLFTWSYQPYVAVGVTSPWDPLLFNASPLPLLGWAVFGIATGALVGTLRKREVGAMALTGLLLVIVMVGVISRADAAAFDLGAPRATEAPGIIQFSGGDLASQGAPLNMAATGDSGTLAGAWLIRAWLMQSDGQPMTRAQQVYMNQHLPSRIGQQRAWLSSRHERFVVQYQPPSRLWLFRALACLALVTAAGAMLMVTVRRSRTIT